MCVWVFGFIYTTVTGAALSFPPTHIPHNSNVNINTLCNVGFELHFSSREMKAARRSFMFYVFLEFLCALNGTLQNRKMQTMLLSCEAVTHMTPEKQVAFVWTA